MLHKLFLVKPGKSVCLGDHDPRYTGKFDKSRARRKLRRAKERLAVLQDILWASKACRLLVIFQAMDGAGKDSTIKHVMSGVNPQGCRVISFRAPTAEELQHPFLWRAEQVLPKPGEIVVFNRSYYEETLVVRVHPEYLSRQTLAPEEKTVGIWDYRFRIINAFEENLAHDPTCPTIILKFFLHESKREQRDRFLDRIDRPEKNWKFNIKDLPERERWDDYMRSYEEMLASTSTPHGMWRVIPADHKWFMHAVVADAIVERLKAQNLRYPVLTRSQRADLCRARRILERE